MELYFISTTQLHDAGKDSFTLIRCEEFDVNNIRIEVFWITTQCSLEGGHNYRMNAATLTPSALHTYVRITYTTT